MTITETILAYLAYCDDADDPDDVPYCIDCGHCDCTCLDNAEDEERNEA